MVGFNGETSSTFEVTGRKSLGKLQLRSSKWNCKFNTNLQYTNTEPNSWAQCKA